ncbi:DUF485 domain-containing protein [Mycolicibacterium sp.]|uniref:DUF485 domain-containing protein n=1 Tax=Mycolicibacterium sp. TaxID=2320850 RepID=UPI003D0AC1AA
MSAPEHPHETVRTVTAPPQPPDWARISALPEFTTLVGRRRRYTTVAVALSMGSLALLVLAMAFAGGVMATTLTGGVSVGIVLAVAEFATLVITGAGWMRLAERDLLPLEAAAVTAAGSIGDVR